MALRCLQGFFQGAQDRVAKCTRCRPFIGAAHFSVEPLRLPDVVRENSAGEHTVAKDVVRDGFMLLAVQTLKKWRRGWGWYATLTAQALQSLRVEASFYSSPSASTVPACRAFCAGAVRYFWGLSQASAGGWQVQKIVGYTDIIAEGRSVFEWRIKVKKLKWVNVEVNQCVRLTLATNTFIVCWQRPFIAQYKQYFFVILHQKLEHNILKKSLFFYFFTVFLTTILVDFL